MCGSEEKKKLFLEIGYTSTKTDPPFCMWHPVGKVRPPGHGGVLLAASPSLCWAFRVIFALLCVQTGEGNTSYTPRSV